MILIRYNPFPTNAEFNRALNRLFHESEGIPAYTAIGNNSDNCTVEVSGDEAEYLSAMREAGFDVVSVRPVFDTYPEAA